MPAFLSFEFRLQFSYQFSRNARASPGSMTGNPPASRIFLIRRSGSRGSKTRCAELPHVGLHVGHFHPVVPHAEQGIVTVLLSSFPARGSCVVVRPDEGGQRGWLLFFRASAFRSQARGRHAVCPHHSTGSRTDRRRRSSRPL